jgi:hypothetical protein
LISSSSDKLRGGTWIFPSWIFPCGIDEGNGGAFGAFLAIGIGGGTFFITITCSKDEIGFTYDFGNSYYLLLGIALENGHHD